MASEDLSWLAYIAGDLSSSESTSSSEPPLWFRSKFSDDIDTDSYIRMKLHGKILDYQTVGGYAKPEEKINEHATNFQVPYIVQPYICGNAQWYF